MGRPSSNHGTLPLATSGPRNRATSSNAQTYDRSHVTGASSSTTSSHNGVHPIHPNPPPSPISALPNFNSNPRRQPYLHQSTHSLGRNRPRSGWSRDQSGYQSGYRTHRMGGPPPTPASTDLNDESESSYAHYQGGLNVGNGYESEYYGAVASRPHPPTPRSQYSDYCPEEEPLMYPDLGNAFAPPPPTRCGSPPLEAEEDDA